MNDMRALSAIFLLGLLVCSISAQEEELSSSAKHLKEKVQQGDYKAILEAVRTGDVTLIPYLKQLNSNMVGRHNSNHPSFYAHIGLAKLGDRDSMQQILAEVDDESPAIQDIGMGKLRLVGGKIAFRKFYELLDDTKPRENTDCLKMFEEHNRKHPGDKLSPYCDVVYWSRSVTTIMTLKSMVVDPPIKTFYGTPEERTLWKEWIRKKGYLID